eukprot:UN24162
MKINNIDYNLDTLEANDQEKKQKHKLRRQGIYDFGIVIGDFEQDVEIGKLIMLTGLPKDEEEWRYGTISVQSLKHEREYVNAQCFIDFDVKFVTDLLDLILDELFPRSVNHHIAEFLVYTGNKYLPPPIDLVNR